MVEEFFKYIGISGETLPENEVDFIRATLNDIHAGVTVKQLLSRLYNPRKKAVDGMPTWLAVSIINGAEQFMSEQMSLPPIVYRQPTGDIGEAIPAMRKTIEALGWEILS